jgi:HK97 family phage major capsid protein
MSKLKELREERARLHNELSQVLTGTDSAESREKAKKLIAAMDVAKVEIDKIETRGLSEVGNGSKNDTDVAYRRAFMSYLRDGETRISPEDREILRTNKRSITEGNIPAQGGSFSSLGYFVPQGFIYDVETALKYYAPLLNGGCFSIMDTATGQLLPYPTNNDTTQTATLVSEGSGPIAEADVTANHIQFSAWKYTSGIVQASLELVQDSAFPIESFLAERFAVRFGRKFESELTNGSGSSRPLGLLNAIASSGATPVLAVGANANSGNSGDTAANSIGTSDLINLEHGVDPAYRQGAKYMFHDLTLAKLKTLLDKFGRPIWQPGISVSEPDRINGYEYVINQSMPVISASSTPIAFGDMKKYLVRRVKDFSVQVLRERYAEFGLTGYLGFMRIDGNLLDAGTHPVNVLQMGS